MRRELEMNNDVYAYMQKTQINQLTIVVQEVSDSEVSPPSALKAI
jgi:hypothetical protein